MMMNNSCPLADPMDRGMDMPGMKMYFHFDACERLLFYTWYITNPGELVVGIIVSFILGVLYEGLKSLREYLLYWDMMRWKNKRSAGDVVNSGSNDKTHLVDENYQKPNKTKLISISFGMHVLQSSLHVIQVAYGYILMLIAMTYNVWLFLAVCFGAGVGYFIFAKTRHIYGINNREHNEHCH